PIVELHNQDSTLTAQKVETGGAVITATLPGVAPLAEPSPNPSLTGRGISIAGALEACIPYLPWLWLIGTPITFALLITGLLRTRRLSRASRLIDDGPITDLLARLTASLKVTRRVTVAVCERIAAPVLIGIVRPMILLPPAA